MRIALIFAALLAVRGLPGLLLQADESEPLPLEQLLSPSQLTKLKREKDYHDRIEILRKAVEARRQSLERQIRTADLERVYRTLRDLESFAHHAQVESDNENNEKELRHGEVKKLEIGLRRLIQDMEDWKLSVGFEDRDRIEAAQAILSDLRNTLLKQLFPTAIGGGSNLTVRGARNRADQDFHHGLPVSSFRPAAFRREPPAQRNPLADLDKFTDDEYSKLQLLQKIKERVEVFMEIAAARLDEIERRRDGVLWDQDELNPLELFTYDDLLHAYVRCLESSMAQIDEKARAKTVSEKELKNALKKLGKHVKEFVPRLEALKPLIRETRDEMLAKKLLAALKASEVALKGVQYGLGVPPE